MAKRWKVFTGVQTRGDPTAGGKVDDVDSRSFSIPESGVQWDGVVAIGRRYRMDTGGSFSAGDDLATDGNGRAVAASSGDVIVARALEGSSGAGDEAWVVMTNQSDTA